MKKRGKMIIWILSVLTVMTLAALTVNAEEIQTGKKPAAAIGKGEDNSKASVAKPKIKTVYNGSDGLHIRVNSRSDVFYYEVYRRCSDDNVNRYVGWAYGYYTDLIDTSVKTKWGKTYAYTLVAYNYCGNRSSVSDRVTYVRVPPVKISASKAESNSKIKVQWKPTTWYGNFSGYEIQYAKSKSNLSNKTGSYRMKTIERGVTSKTLTGLSKGTTYYIRLRAFKKCKLSSGKWKKCYSTYTKIVKIRTKSNATVTKYRALLIGNGDYYFANDLSGPKNDAKATASMLSKYHYSTTKKYNLTKPQILSAIRSAFSGASSNDVSLFFYSGHGSNNYSGSMGYLVGVDSSYLSMSELASALKKIPGRVIVVLDSCFSGNAISKDAGMEYSPEKFDRAAVNAFAAADTVIETNPGSDAAEKNGELRNGKFLVLAGGQKGELTYDVPQNGLYGGLFTRYFVQGAGCSFPSGNYSGRIPSDSNYDKKVTLKEMYNYTRRNVLAYNGRQHVTCYPSGSNGVLFKK